MTDPVVIARSRLGGAVRLGTPEAQRAARQELAAAKLERAINEAIAAAPPLTDEARERLAMLLLRGAK